MSSNKMRSVQREETEDRQAGWENNPDGDMFWEPYPGDSLFPSPRSQLMFAHLGSQLLSLQLCPRCWDSQSGNKLWELLPLPLSVHVSSNWIASGL